MAQNRLPLDHQQRRSLPLWLKTHRTRVLLWLRLSVAFALMAVVVVLVASDREKLTDVDWTLIPVAFSFMLISMVVKSLRWMLLVRESGMNVTFRRLLGTYLVGAFFSTVLPTSVGGDAVRAVDTAATTGRVADSTSSVLLERVIGLLAVFAGGSFFAFFMEPNKAPQGFLVIVHVLFLGVIAGLVMLRQGWFMGPIALVLNRLHFNGMMGKVLSLQEAFSEQLWRPGVLVVMFLLSLIANALTMGATYIVLVAVTDPIPLAAFVPMMALATAAELIPISPAAIGVKESAYVFFLGLAKVGSVEAGVVAIITRVLTWGLALLGGLVFLWRTLQAQSAKDRQPPSSPSGGSARRNGHEPRLADLLEHEDTRQDDMVGLPSNT